MPLVKAKDREQYVMDMPELAAEDIAGKENQLTAIRIYCKACAEQHPQTAPFMKKIIQLAGDE